MGSRGQLICREPGNPVGSNGSDFGGRICDVDGIGATDERITNFGAVARTLTVMRRPAS